MSMTLSKKSLTQLRVSLGNYLTFAPMLLSTFWKTKVKRWQQFSMTGANFACQPFLCNTWHLLKKGKIFMIIFIWYALRLYILDCCMHYICYCNVRVFQLGKPSFKKIKKIMENFIIGLTPPSPPFFGQNYGKFWKILIILWPQKVV